MKAKTLAIVTGALLVGTLLLCELSMSAEARNERVVRLAEVEVDHAHLNTYKAALRREIEASVRAEPGVLTLYAVSIRDQPARILIFETYADEVAYKAHLETPHFKKYKTTTQAMVKSLRLIETEPIMLGTKPR